MEERNEDVLYAHPDAYRLSYNVDETADFGIILAERTTRHTKAVQQEAGEKPMTVV